VGGEEVSVEDPDFYIVDDKYSDERRLILEPLVRGITHYWLTAVSDALDPFSGWDVLVHLDGGVDLVVSTDKVRVFGLTPEGGTIEALVRELRRRKPN
jgi:hypothetical protein